MDTINQVREDIESIIKKASFYSKLKLIEEHYVHRDRLEQEISISGRISTNHKSEESEISKQVSNVLISKYGPELANEKMQSTWQVICGIADGDKFTFMDVEDLQGNKTKVEHKNGNILLVDIWATWCGYCHEPMQHNVDCMAKNTDFAAKNVSIVGISCDQDVSKWKSFVATKKWNTIPQYRNVNAMKICGVQGIPFIFIVNREGIVVYQGHPMSIDLENSLKNLIVGKNIIKVGSDEESDTDVNPFWNELDSETKKEIVNECTTMLLNFGLGDIQFFVLTTKTKNLGTGIETVTNVPILQGYLSEEQYELVDNVLIEMQSMYNLNGIRPQLRMK